MNRVAQYEDAFKKRYGKEVEVYSELVKENGKLKKAIRKVIDKLGTYEIIEFFTDDIITDYVMSGEQGNLKTFRNYITAEIYIADLIGEKQYGRLK